MSSHHSPADKTGPSSLVWRLVSLLVFIVLAAWIAAYQESVFQAAKRYFMLERADVCMIPVGALFFVTLWQLLGKFLFNPYLKLLEEREAAGSGAIQAAAQLSAKSSHLVQDYEEKIAAARVAAARGKTSALGQAKAESAAVLKKAQDEALRYLEEERFRIAAAAAQMRAAAMKRADELAQAVVEKALVPPRAPARLFH